MNANIYFEQEASLFNHVAQQLTNITGHTWKNVADDRQELADATTLGDIADVATKINDIIYVSSIIDTRKTETHTVMAIRIKISLIFILSPNPFSEKINQLDIARVEHNDLENDLDIILKKMWTNQVLPFIDMLRSSLHSLTVKRIENDKIW